MCFNLVEKMNFHGKVVLITGAASGIGADAARHLAKHGAKVSIVDINEKLLAEVADEIKKSGSPAPLAIVADVTTDSERIVDETIKHFGQLDVLVNNAGIAIRDNVADGKISEFDRLFNINVRSLITLTKCGVPHLEKTKGNIVNTSSVCGLMPVQNCMSYCMSKAAVNQFTKCSALDLAPKGIRVNSINPAVVETALHDSIGRTAEKSEAYYERFSNRYPVGRVGDVSDVSAAIAYLADDTSASFLTGINLPVDGGALVAGFVL